MNSTPNLLIFSASDPTSGAGMQADIQTVSSLGCHPLAVITGLTVQDTKGVYHVSPVESKLFAAQAQTILDDSKVDQAAVTPWVLFLKAFSRSNFFIPLT